MKIGILTHHYVKNYGAFLQMKSLYEVIRQIYPQAEISIVNYVKYKHWQKNILHVLHYRKSIDSLHTYASKVKQLLVFTKYERSLPRTRKVYSASGIAKLGLDMLILGSDEIWNIQGSGYHPLKFGCGVEKLNVIAYAPSVGAVTEETVVPDEIKGGLSSIRFVSGRDEESIKFVKRAVGREAVKMPDPTFLYNFDKDIKAEGIRPKPFKYILLYDCKLTDELVVLLCGYAKKHGYRILGAGDYKAFYDEVTINLTPYEWVDLFRNAGKVITGTFHGTVFSVKYDRDFICYPTEKNRINKISSLLADIKLSERLMKIGEEEKFDSLIDEIPDYAYAHEYLTCKKREAIDFLHIK